MAKKISENQSNDATKAENITEQNTSLNVGKADNSVKIAKKGSKKTDVKNNEVKKALRSGNPAKVSKVIAKDEVSKQKVAINLAKNGLNPAWLVPTMVGLFVIGIVWVIIFYLTAENGGYPIPAIRYGNLVVGFVFIIGGFGLATRWK